MNIPSLIESQLSPQAISQISNTIGESPESTKAALGTAIPAVLGSLIGKANASLEGATQIFNTLQEDQGGWMNSISSFLSGGASAAQAGSGNLLNSLLGTKLGPIAEFISGHCGIRNSSALSLLGMATSWVMGTLSQHVTSQGTGAAGLGQLLNSQAENLKGVLPAELANTIGVGSLLSGASETTRVPTEAAQPRTDCASVPATTAIASRGSALKWAVPLLIVAAVALFALSHTSENSAGGSADSVHSQTGHAVSMPDVSNLNLPPGSIAERVAKAAPDPRSSQRFELPGQIFDSSGNPSQSARTELQQLASVMKLAPHLNIGVTCYGATAEDGKQKAESLKSVLTSAGILPGRVLARGESGSGTTTLRLVK